MACARQTHALVLDYARALLGDGVAWETPAVGEEAEMGCLPPPSLFSSCACVRARGPGTAVAVSPQATGLADYDNEALGEGHFLFFPSQLPNHTPPLHFLRHTLESGQLFI
jgi:hypothetical protein